MWLSPVPLCTWSMISSRDNPPPLLGFRFFIEGMQLAGLDDFSQAKDGHQSVLAVERVELRVGVVEVPVGSGRLQPL